MNTLHTQVSTRAPRRIQRENSKGLAQVLSTGFGSDCDTALRKSASSTHITSQRKKQRRLPQGRPARTRPQGSAATCGSSTVCAKHACQPCNPWLASQTRVKCPASRGSFETRGPQEGINAKEAPYNWSLVLCAPPEKQRPSAQRCLPKHTHIIANIPDTFSRCSENTAQTPSEQVCLEITLQGTQQLSLDPALPTHPPAITPPNQCSPKKIGTGRAPHRTSCVAQPRCGIVLRSARVDVSVAECTRSGSYGPSIKGSLWNDGIRSSNWIAVGRLESSWRFSHLNSHPRISAISSSASIL